MSDAIFAAALRGLLGFGDRTGERERPPRLAQDCACKSGADVVGPTGVCARIPASIVRAPTVPLVLPVASPGHPFPAGSVISRKREDFVFTSHPRCQVSGKIRSSMAPFGRVPGKCGPSKKKGTSTHTHTHTSARSTHTHAIPGSCWSAVRRCSGGHRSLLRICM